MKRTFPKIIGATTLALGAQMAQGGEFMDRPIELSLTEKQIRELCIQTQNNSRAIVNRPEVCEISTDNGKTWILLTAALAAGLLGAGYSKRKKIQPYLVRFLDRKKADRNIMDGPEPLVIEPKLLETASVSEAKAAWISRIKTVLSKNTKPDPSWLATVAITPTPEAVSAAISEEHMKRMQELKDALDTGLSDQDAMRAFYRQADEIIEDMSYSTEERNQVRAWRRTVDLKGKESGDFLKTYPIDPVIAALPDKNNDTIVTLTDVHEPLVIEVDQIRLGEAPFSTLGVTYVTGEESGEPFSPGDVSGMVDSMDEEFRGLNFEFFIKGDRILAKGLSDGGKKYMQDYVSISSDGNTTTMIVLDGVGSGAPGATEQYVAEIGTALGNVSLFDLIDDPDSCLANDDFQGVATTVGRASINNNRISFEKIGDVGIVVFDTYGGIKYQNIGGGYIPVDWLESDDIVDPTVRGQARDIIRMLQLHFGEDKIIPPPGPLKKREFMKAFSSSTRQLQPRSEENAERDMEFMSMELAHDDIVFMATDGVFDNLSVDHIGRLIMDKTSSTHAVDMVLSQLDRIWSSHVGDFGSFKPDNIGLAIYRHVVAPVAGITGPVESVDIDL